MVVILKLAGPSPPPPRAGTCFLSPHAWALRFGCAVGAASCVPHIRFPCPFLISSGCLKVFYSMWPVP